MSKYRKAPSGEWLGYPELRIEDIEHEAFQYSKYVSQSLVDNRKGRVHLIIEHEDYRRFLDAVKKRFGNISASNVEKAMMEAVKGWVESIS